MNEIKEGNAVNSKSEDKKLSEMNEEEINEFQKRAKKIMIRPRNARINAM